MIPNWVKERISKGNTFVISSHINPDADGAGSCAAMAWLLRKLGKTASIVNAERLPPSFRFLENLFPVSQRPSKTDKSADIWFVLDSSKLVRTGLNIADMPQELLCIDHHYDNETYGRENWVDGQAPATAELIFSLIRSYGIAPDLPVAEALYAGVLVDTGGFKFSNTGERAFAMSAELMRCGVDSQKIYKSVFLDKSVERVRLEGTLMSQAELLLDGRVCVMQVTDEILKATGASREDLEGISNLTMSLRDAEVGLLFVRIGNKTKVCFRSNGNRNVRDVASLFGGGGHAAAAGCVMDATLAEARSRVMEKVADLLKQKAVAGPATLSPVPMALEA